MPPRKRAYRGNYKKNPNERKNKGDRNDPDWSKNKSYFENKARERRLQTEKDDDLDTEFGFERWTGASRLGFVFNMKTTSLLDEESGNELSAVDFYLVQEDGETFKATYIMNPYFLISVKGGLNQCQEVEGYLMRKFEAEITDIKIIQKEDLDMANHLAGNKRTFMKLSFSNVQLLMQVRKRLMPIIQRNKVERDAVETYMDLNPNSGPSSLEDFKQRDGVLDCIIDIREYDVPYIQRVAIDTGLRVGLWYNVEGIHGTKGCSFTLRSDLVERPITKTIAWDIETTKLPLKFPNADFDKIMMISYMIDGEGFLIVNREIVSQDIEDFEYTPKPEFEGPFEVFNEENELATINRFFDHIREEKPLIHVTYNGDFFDWPFVEKRAATYGISLRDSIGVWEDKGEYKGRFTVHLDAFHWVKRDSYLPQGSQGLKAVTKYKLKYDPVELDPEDMLPFASEKPQVLAAYSVSDAVATYYLYKVYVHLFIFSLCNIIPLPPSDVLRKGSGTLCELLLMVKAYEGNIVCPNKQKSKTEQFYHGHLLESETYIGGHVEGLESGIFRDDIPCKFKVKPERFTQLMNDLDSTLEFVIVEENNTEVKDVVNYDEIRDAIKEKLQKLHDEPVLETLPMIYHLDVGAMYPNIILTNRLQPMAIVQPSDCASCDFNRPGSNCQRVMDWSWRGKYYPASRSEYQAVKDQLEYETPRPDPNVKIHRPVRTFRDLPSDMQTAQIQKRMKIYSHKVYKKFTVETVEAKKATVCQRENPFYVNTVRDFRDRRYQYKGLKKKWGKVEREAKEAVDLVKAKDMVLLYDSLQLAHKCILNSFYGYVMRKGARWQSIEMAGVVTKTGADIIKDARLLVEDIGRPLELDTDGIWCIIPDTFPENYKVKTKSGKSFTLSYPCALLNKLTNDLYTNDQYQDLDDEISQEYRTHSECSIFFEVDGPYRAMVLPASKDEGKSIKKRYAVFNKDGSLAELKGFEIKRRGELKLIKIFQGQVFKSFLLGESLQTCYDNVGACANHWLDIMYNQGADLEDSDVFDLISESKNMAQDLAAYGDAKSTAITTAKRLGEFLGRETVEKKGLKCQFVITKKPAGAPTSQRAVPTAIFSAEPAIKRSFLRKWLRDSSLTDFDIRNLIDWEYYITRLGSAIQKIITIPAAFQSIDNPCPRVEHPDWLKRRIREQKDPHKQQGLLSYFSKKPLADLDNESMMDVDSKENPPAQGQENADPQQGGAEMMDIEDLTKPHSFTSPLQKKYRAKVVRRAKSRTPTRISIGSDDMDDEEAHTLSTNAALRALREGDGESDAMDIITDECDLQNMDIAEEKEKKEQVPDHDTDNDSWIKYQFKQWKALRNRKKEEKMAEVARQHGRSGNSSYEHKQASLSARGGLRGFFQAEAMDILNGYWQIIQIVPDVSMPGIFNAWIFTETGGLRNIQIQVPRKIYLNGVDSNVASDAGRKVDRLLPRGRRAQHLYEIEMPEIDFQESSKELMSFLTHPDVEGVYETNTPLLFKLLMQVGCVCEYTSGESKNNLYPMSELQYKSTHEYAYLEDVNFHEIFLYQSTTTPRQMFGLHLKAQGRFVIAVVNPRKGKVEHINFPALWKGIEGMEEDFIQQNENMPQEFDLQDFTNVEEAYAYLSQKLSEYKGEYPQPTLVISQCQESLQTLYQEMPVLKTEFPVISLPSNDMDNQYPALQWVTHAANRMLLRAFASKLWIQDQLTFCRYAQCPIGNVESDTSSFLADILFARSLHNSNHLLWLSNSPQPDLGGFEEDDNYFAGEHSNPELISQGCYRSVCIELDIQHLAVNAVLKHSLIEELEGGMATRQGVDGKVEPAFDCQDAFRILKSMISGWFDDVLHDDADADYFLRHFYRWLRSSSSKLYDPSLTRMVHIMMKKYFLQLIARFKKLGGHVIYASFTKVILCTNKPTVPRAIAWIKYVMETILSKPLFEFLKVDVVRVWECLLFMDEANYGGILAKGQENTPVEEPVSDDDRKLSDSDPEDGSGPSEERLARRENNDCLQRLESNWDIANYLPDMARDIFNVAVTQFFVLPYQHQQSLLLQDADRGQHESAETKAENFKAYLTELVDTYFNRQLYAGVRDVMNNFPTDAHAYNNGESSSHFPKLAGSHLPMHNPALEFIKFVTKVFSLDSTIEMPVLKLRENLMKMVDVRTFSKQAQFQNPCRTFVLPDVICPVCNYCRDLDLCRNPQLAEHKWKCEECAQPLDKMSIECELVRIVQRRSVAYQLQDLSCVVCGNVKQGNLNKYCQCSGKFQVHQTPKEFRDGMIAFQNIAEYHNFKWLQETVENLLA